MTYQLLKLIHIISATFLFGAGAGTALLIFRAYRENLKNNASVETLAFALSHAIFVDWFFTMTAGIIQLITGVSLGMLGGFSFTHGWLFVAIIMFCLIFLLQDNWESVSKRYLVVVHGKPKQKSGILTDYLAESGSHRVYVTSDKSEGRLARTRYNVLNETAKYSLLEVELLTGRKHQIRVQFSQAGFPILGDGKYGIQDSYKKRMALHALSLNFTHPITGKVLHFETIVPPFFQRFQRVAGEKADETLPKIMGNEF